ncbi:diaminopimelate decarboxylase [Aliidongia dinghuensis]|uniref:Diaminopimelate decarboxylase n=1 Tax=Aliidongia dinghuensis TaxID=1867774 RepID=A0A8J3E6Q1_9PROT|nr:diaminopimelate decarboxylase [Aliidongia dinghuensis]GGF46699.1 diaminopimelate decarboxylase [Aliidongia dinghuensis]
MSETFAYVNGRLHAEEVDLARIAETVGTPFYCYSTAAIAQRYRRFEAAVAPLGGRICYAVKANSNQAVLATLAGLGAGADVVSEGEARRAVAAGVPPERIVFSGVGKTEAELVYALETGIGQVNIESERDLELLSRLAVAHGRHMPIAIRVNPDVDALTHAKIATGKAENKFGIDIDAAPRVFARAAALPGVEPVAVALHIGSQLTDFTPYEQAFSRVAELVRALRADGIPIRHLDLGGGIGVSYHGGPAPDVAAYAEIVQRTVGDLDCALLFEPGRYLVAEAGVLVGTVIDVKQGATRRFVVADFAMNDLIRPTLYEAYHPILPVIEPLLGATTSVVDVVGPICETGDFLARDRALPPVAPGDLLAVTHAGAYGAVMSSTYNTRPTVPEVLVTGARWAVVRPRPTYDELIGLDRMPDWLAGDSGTR